MTGAKYFARLLEAYGVTHVFFMDAVLVTSIILMLDMGGINLQNNFLLTLIIMGGKQNIENYKKSYYYVTNMISEIKFNNYTLFNVEQNFNYDFKEINTKPLFMDVVSSIWYNIRRNSNISFNKSFNLFTFSFPLEFLFFSVIIEPLF